MRIINTIPLVSLFLLIGILRTHAQPGSLDPTFNTIDDCTYGDGSGFGIYDAGVFVALQNDSKLIIYGDNFTSFNGTTVPRIARLNSDGSLDNSFQLDSTIIALDNTLYNYRPLIIQNNGKILICRNASGQIWRLNIDGSIDNSFDDGIGFIGGVGAIAIQEDGKIIVGGDFTSYDGNVVNRIVRINSDGTFDSSFQSINGFNSSIYSISIQTDGKIIVGGAFNNSSGGSLNKLTRLNSDGTMDNTFLNNGSGFNDVVSKTAIQPDGKILVFGSFTNYKSSGRDGLIRLNSNGTLDISFNNLQGGSNLFTASNLSETIKGKPLIQPDGKILVVGDGNGYGLNRKGLCRLLINGQFDTTFNNSVGLYNYSYVADYAGFNSGSSQQNIALQNDGKIIATGNFDAYNKTVRHGIIRLYADGLPDETFMPGVGFDNIVKTVSIQPDGKIICGGSFNCFKDAARTKIVRLNNDGTVDYSFDPGKGVNSSYFGNTNPYGGICSSALQQDGKILICGAFSSYNGSIYYNDIVRLNSDGTLDSTFHISFTFNPFNVYDVKIQGDGKILIAGLLNSLSDIMRLNPDGSLDNSFILQTGLQFTVGAIELQPDGKILAFGDFGSRILRLNNDGTLDSSFNPAVGNNGFNQLGHVPDIEKYCSIAVQPDGKIIVVGDFSSYNGQSTNYITRINSDGSIDPTFNPGSGFNDLARSLVLQSDGKIIVGGSFTNYNGTSVNYLVRLNSDGSIDQSFNTINGFNAKVYALAIQQDGKVITGGDFTKYNGSCRTRIARLEGICQNNTFAVDAISACDSLVWLDGNTYTASNNSASFIIPNEAGCDSLITLNLTINSSTAPVGSTTQSFCNNASISDLSADGNNIQWYNSNNGGQVIEPSTLVLDGGTYYATQTLNGCESNDRLAVSISINETSAPTGSQSQTFCSNATVSNLEANGSNILWYLTSNFSNALISSTELSNGLVYYASQSLNNCESAELLTVQVSIITNPNNNITINSNSIIANQQNANYQWLDCSNNFEPINGANQVEFFPEFSGDFAVAINLNNCADTSSCINFEALPTGIVKTNSGETTIQIYPNPNDGNFTLNSRFSGNFNLVDCLGKTLLNFELEANNPKVFANQNIAKGIYFIVNASTGQPICKVVLNQMSN